MTTNTASADNRRGLMSAPGDSAASALELMSPDRSGQKMRFLGDIVDPDEAADPAEMPPTFAEGDLVWFDQGTSPGTRGHRAVAFKCRVKDVFHVGFASYEFTVLPLIRVCVKFRVTFQDASPFLTEKHKSEPFSEIIRIRIRISCFSKLKSDW